MSEFKVINSQEEFDAAIGSRLKREREQIEKKFEGFVSPDEVTALKAGFAEYTSPEGVKNIRAKYEEQIGELNDRITESAEKAKEYDDKLKEYEVNIAERDAKIKGFEIAALKETIAHEAGLPYGMGSRLRGEEEADIRKDAEILSGMVGKFDTPPRYAGGTENVHTGIDSALSALSSGLSMF